MFYKRKYFFDDSGWQSLIYNAKHIQYKEIVDRLNPNIVRYLNLNKSQPVNILDIGSGIGIYRDLILEELKDSPISYYSLDNNIELCHNKYSKGNFILSDINQGLPIKDKMFDIIIFFNTLSYSQYVDKFVKELSRIMTDGGIIFVKEIDILTNLVSCLEFESYMDFFSSVYSKFQSKKLFYNPFLGRQLYNIFKNDFEIFDFSPIYHIFSTNHDYFISYYREYLARLLNEFGDEFKDRTRQDFINQVNSENINLAVSLEYFISAKKIQKG